MEISANKQAYIYAAVAATVVVGIGLSPLGTRLAQSILAKLPSSLSPSLNSPLVGRATTLLTAAITSSAVYAYLAPNTQPDPSTKKNENKKKTDRPDVLLSVHTRKELMFNQAENRYYVQLTPGAPRDG